MNIINHHAPAACSAAFSTYFDAWVYRHAHVYRTLDSTPASRHSPLAVHRMARLVQRRLWNMHQQSSLALAARCHEPLSFFRMKTSLTIAHIPQTTVYPRRQTICSSCARRCTVTTTHRRLFWCTARPELVGPARTLPLTGKRILDFSQALLKRRLSTLSVWY